MDFDPRVWNNNIIISESSNPAPYHESNHHYHHHSDPALYYQSPMSAGAVPRVHNPDPDPIYSDLPSRYPCSSNSYPYSYPPTSAPQYSYHTHHSAALIPDPQMSFQRASPKSDVYYAPNSVDAYSHSQTWSAPPSPSADSGSSHTGQGANHYPSSSGVPRLPPILQVEKQQVTTSATQLASASRRRNEAHFVCPVPGCGSTFTRRFNLRGHLRSHTEERPYVCEWPGCKKGFARQHDCKRHQALHSAKSQSNVCQGCKKTFSRLDALNRHLRSEGGAECRPFNQKTAATSMADPKNTQS